MIFQRKMNCYLTSKNASIPTKATDGSAGWDLYCVSDICIPPNGNGGKATEVPHDIKLEFPDSKCYGRIASRSSLTKNHNIIVGCGVVDNDYW